MSPATYPACFRHPGLLRRHGIGWTGPSGIFGFSHYRINAFGKFWNFIDPKQPGSAFIPEYISLGLGVWIVIKKSGWNHDVLSVSTQARDSTAAFPAKPSHISGI